MSEALKMIEPCRHDISEQDVAAQADGLCPLCLYERVRTMRSALEEIITQGPQRVARIARAALDNQ